MVSHLYNISFIFLTSLFMVDFIVYIRVIRVIRSLDHPLFSFVIMSFCLQKNHLSPFVIMSFCLQENHLSPFFIMSFCLQKNICLHFSLCHSVFKKIICLHLSLCHSVFKKIICLHLSLCHSVFKNPSVFVRLPVILSQKNHLSSFVIMSFCLQKNICLHLSLCHSVFINPPVFVRLPVILSLIYSVCLMLKCLYKEAYKGPEKRRGICIRSGVCNYHVFSWL